MILIPFSSGLDSTALVYQALEKKENFRLCYINLKNNTNKTEIELNQRKKIISLFEKKYDLHIRDEANIEISINSNLVISLPQMPAWIMGLLYSIDSNVKEIRMGYCMNDDAASYVEDLKRIWKSYQSISHHKLPRLTFPLLKVCKMNTLKYLPDEIFQETFFCEAPTILTAYGQTWEDCGTCGPCKRAIYDETFTQYKRNQQKTLEKAHFISQLESLEPASIITMDVESEGDAMIQMDIDENVKGIQ